MEKTNAISEERKTKWREVLVTSFVSSEESGGETLEGETVHFLNVKSLPWRVAKVGKFIKLMMKKLRRHNQKEQTSKH